MQTAFERLRGILEGLRIYSFAEGTLSRAELEAAGGAIDDLVGRIAAVEREISPLTAVGEGLELFEELLGHAPPDGIEARRTAILVQLASERALDLTALERALLICGLAVSVREDGECLIVEFPGVAGVPDGFEALRREVEALLPCHLEPSYKFNFITWELFEKWFPTWEVLDGSGFSWEEIELIIE